MRSHIAWSVMALTLVLASAAPRADAVTAPNVVPIDANLVTSGQPDAAALSRLASEGFQAVIYLAPNTVGDAVKEEPALLAKQGIEFVHIPIPFSAPSDTHLAALVQALDRLKGRKVLVHCQVNLRASAMVFLYRTLHRKEDPARAYASVSRVWSPEGPWKRFIVRQLESHRIPFEPL